MIDLFNGFYKGKRVLITGHTGFKGSWLSVWLHELGAEVIGVSLDPHNPKDNYCLTNIGRKITADLRTDIRDSDALKQIFAIQQPEIVFHLAAQPIVRLSYAEPIMTYETNVMGTVNVMEAIRATDSVKVGVMITTDKCYENHEQTKGYKETDSFGGYDPYSSSKGACEIAIASWRNSFFNPIFFGTKHHVSLSSVRAGNVIGGGDWSEDRIIPDCIRAIETNSPIVIRSPHSIRPWEHVLEPLSGYLTLARRQWEFPTKYCEGWNFGPEENAICTVEELAKSLCGFFEYNNIVVTASSDDLHEAKLLRLNIDKAKNRLDWHPRLNAIKTIELVAEWYKRYKSEDVYHLCTEQINSFAELEFNKTQK